MNENPIMIVLYIGVAAYVLSMYRGDLKAELAGEGSASAMPGAKPFGWLAALIGVIGALIILAIETGGEIALGISAEQSDMVWYFVFASLAAGVVEEVIFRGFWSFRTKVRQHWLAVVSGFRSCLR